MKNLSYFLLITSILFNYVANAQETIPISQQKDDVTSIILHQQEAGDILYKIQLLNDREPLGVTIIDNIIYITSSDGNGNNHWDKYNLDGTYIASVEQGTTSSYGYRDLAYDGTHILASDDKDIDKIDPNTFAIVSTITNAGHSPHRGLAYDPNEDVIYSTNWIWEPCIKINATTGETVKELNKPILSPYGIAIDRFTHSNYAYLWYAAPTTYNTFKISRVDTTHGNINFTFDITNELGDSCLVGGLEIINNHPDYANKTIAVVVEQHSRQLVFVDITDAPEILPGSLTEVGEFGGWDADGMITYGMVQHSDYLYAVNNGDLDIYDINTDPKVPNFVKNIPVGNGNKIFFYNDLLIISKGKPSPNSFSIYRLTDPLNPTFISTFDTGNPILDMVFYGNYAFLIQSDVPQMTVYDLSDLSNPSQHFVFNLPTFGSALEINSSKKILFISYYSGTQINNGILLVDISNMDAIQELDRISTDAKKPQRMAIIDDSYLATMLNSSNDDGCLVSIYDYSDGQNILYTDREYVSWTIGGWDLIRLEDILVVTIPTEGIKTLYWDTVTQKFSFGPYLEFPEPLDIITYIPPTSSLNIKSNLKNISLNSDIIYVYQTNGYGYSYYANGSLPNKVIQLRKPGVPGQTPKVKLTMSVNPSEAASNGCSTIPAVGVHEYEINTQINLYAVPDATNGWYFLGWSGDVSGTDLIVPILMDEDKVAQANFGKIELTISGSIDKKIYCPNKIEEEKRLLELPFIACASDADGWILSKISFRASGTGNDATDIETVTLYKGNTVSYTGKYSTDNGTIDVTFSPPITIGAGQCVPFRLTYDYGFTADTYAKDETQSFHVESFGVVAKPLTHEDGDISGKAKNDSLVIARVINSKDYYFSKINDAVNSTLTTSGDTCYVCAGTYNENIQLLDTTKAISIVSYEGAEKTIVIPKVIWDWAFLFHGSPYKNIVGFTINGNNERGNGVAIVGGKNSLVKDNIISNMETGVRLSKTINSEVIKNTFLNNETGIEIYKAASNNVYDNYIQSIGDESPSINLYMSDMNQVHYNKIYDITSNATGMIINLEKSSHNKIYTHYALKNSNHSTEIILKDNSFANELYSNENYTFKITKFADSNYIHNNKTKSIYLSSCIETTIENNTISDGDGILVIDDAYYTSGTSRLTYIKRNKIFNNKSDGISVIGGSVNIIRNEIYNNGTSNAINAGVNLRDISVNGLVHENDIYDNGEHGVYVSDCKDVSISNNNITGHNKGIEGDGTTVGVFIFGQIAGTNYIMNNFISENCTGIELKRCDNVIVRNNDVDDSFCWNTGIHVSNSSASIIGNSISNNNGNGVFCEDGSSLKISNNNIEGNTEFGVNNGNSEGTIIADNNYWGNANGPTLEDLEGNVDASVWLSEKVSIVASSEKDTIYVSSGVEDSLILFLQNLSVKKDKLLLTISDSKNWVTAVNDIEISLTDSAGYPYSIKYIVPTNINDNEMSVINYSVISSADSSEVSGSIYLTSYLPTVNKLEVSNNNSTIGLGDTLQFVASAIDQFGNNIDVNVDWSASRGTIDENGLFIAPNVEGEVEVTATNQESGINAKSVLFITGETEVLTSIVISPDSVKINPFEHKQYTAKGENQFGYPIPFEAIWHSTGGTIDDNGLFAADSISGLFFIIASDTSGNIVDTAIVIVEDTTPMLASIILEPDSVVLKFGESYQFVFSATDQFGDSLGFNPVWQATGGNISNDGFYVADSTVGTYFVKLGANESEVFDSSVVIIEEALNVEENIPNTFFLTQNYPNPFNPSTTINFGLKEEGNVKLEIFNVLGERVLIPVNKDMKAGKYSISVKFGNLSSGIYIYRINVKGKYTNVKKMILLR